MKGWDSVWLNLGDNDGHPGGGLPTDAARRLVGPWLQTQLTLSLLIGTASFLLFCYMRRIHKYKVLYSPRTLLKGFSPHEVHDSSSFFGWILPTLRTSEFTVLQIVGLDAAVLLSFLRMAFLFFLSCTILAAFILVPINYRENGSSEGVPMENSTLPSFLSGSSYSSFDAYSSKASHGSTVYLTTHLAFTYTFSLIALFFLSRNYARYIPLRQLFSLELAHSIPARTVMVTALPPHLQSERSLAEYFESIHLGVNGDSGGLGVESVSVVRAVGGMQELLEARTKALRTLEVAWSKYLGNPVPVQGPKAVYGYVPREEVERIVDLGITPPRTPPSGDVPEGQLIDVDSTDDTPPTPSLPASNTDLEAALSQTAASRSHILNATKKRPTITTSFFSKPIDALEHYAAAFRTADDNVKTRRKGKFRPTGVAFVTFESLASAQIVAQAVHYPSVDVFKTELAPEPRDIQWFNLSISRSSVLARQLLVSVAVLLLLSLWSLPVVALTQLLNLTNIERLFPRFAKLLAMSPILRTLVQNFLPSVSLIMFNAGLPFFLEALSVFQGLQARSWIEYSLLKKYHLSILFTTFFVFVGSDTFNLLKQLSSEGPAKILDLLAKSLPGARNFFVSYVMLSGLAIMPLQLLELATIVPRMFYKIFLTRTPRDHAELNAPPMINLGTVYPQGILIFTIGLTYSVISPLILPFATIYFGLAYLVYKYKLLFVYYRPYESRGQAWPITFNRIAFGLLVFQTFQLSLFIFRQAFLLSALMAPLLLGTLYTTMKIHSNYKPLSRFVNLSQACELSNGEGDIAKLRRGHPVTRSQSNLNRGRYGANDDGLYVVGQNDATDYAQPPLSYSYPGVLNTGRRRYGHPALSGALPEPWLPVLTKPDDTVDTPEVVKDALVLDLRRRWSRVKRAARSGVRVIPGVNLSHREGEESHGMEDEDPSRAWRGSSASLRSQIGAGVEQDDDLGVLALSDDEGEDTRYSTYFHRHSKTYPPAPSSETEDER